MQTGLQGRSQQTGPNSCVNAVLNESMPGKVPYLLFEGIQDLVEGFELSGITG
jgi:hypothetical protein